MLGVYDNFPENIHRTASFTSSTSPKMLQDGLVQALYDMNKTPAGSEEIDQHALRQCAVVFETGVAESGSFNYVDEAEVRRLQDSLKKEPFRIIDFFLAARYHKAREGGRSPLRFDYFLVRVVFSGNSLEMRVFHERGPRYISPEDVNNLVVGRINRQAARRILKSP